MTTRIALVGLGGPTAATYLECLRQMPEVLPAAVVEPQSRPGTDQGSWLQAVATFPHHRDLLERFPADGMVICDSGGCRKGTAVDCIRAGKAILCESPIAEALLEAREIWAISQAHEVLFGVCFPIRSSKACSRIRKRILEGRLGNPLTVRVRRPEGGGAAPLSGDPCGDGGGPWIHPGTALVDSLRWLLSGEFTLVTLMGSGDKAGDGSGWLRLEMNQGSVAIMEASLMDPPGVVRIAGAVWLEICGPRGRVELELFTGADSDGSAPDSDSPAETPIGRMLANFVEAVRGRTPIAAGGTDGLRAMEVVQAARRAWRYRTAVVL